MFNMGDVLYLILAFVLAFILTFVSSPVANKLAYKIGAVDVPKDSRRMHKKPVARLGGLAIYFGVLVSVLCISEFNSQFFAILIGATIIVVLGVIDDSSPLPAWIKLLVQIGAAIIPAVSGVTIVQFTNPNIFSNEAFMLLGWFSVPVTVLWIVGITNSVNFIDGLDGLAVGISTIAAVSLIFISLFMQAYEVALIAAAISGSCFGFMPYNKNPAKMFMGDTGATFLGYMLACMSIQGSFKSYAAISFVVPFLILGLPIFDTSFAVVRRVMHGRSPMSADREHLHHKLIDLGLSQKQSVLVLYVINGILGLTAVVLSFSGAFRALILLLCVIIAIVIASRFLVSKPANLEDIDVVEFARSEENNDA